MGDRIMKTKNSIKIISFLGFMTGFTFSMGCGSEYWQGMVAGSILGIWMILVGAEE